MRYSKIILAAAVALVAVAGCKSQYEELLESSDVKAKYKAAFEYYNSGKYSKAVQLFESISLAVSGTPQDDTVQFYTAMANYNQRDFYTAEGNLTHFIENYPASPFIENAQFLRVDCLYRATLRYELDQKPTYAAITAINEYKMTHLDSPNIAICNRMLEDLNERLDRKAFENARLYYKMEDYKASRVAFKNVLKDNADNIYREEILYYAAMSSYKYALNSVEGKQKERYMVFIDDYLNFVGEYPESKHRKELDSLYEKARKK